jgi:hypothetical protein
MQPIYMDNNATTACDPAVVAAMLPFFTEQFGNASSIHSFGSQVGKAIKEARIKVQSLLGAAHDSEIVFTSCGTESDSTAILSALKANPERRTVITTVVEHPAILTLCTYLEKENYVVHRLRVDRKGRIDLDEYKSLLNDRVAIVSAMWANNETGTLFPGRGNGRDGAREGRPVPHRRRAGRRQGRYRPEKHEDRHAVVVRSQVARPERHRRVVRASQHPLSPAAAGWPSGTRSPRRAPKTRRRSLAWG